MASGSAKSHTLKEIAARFGGEVAGDDSVRVQQVATLASAGPGHIAFLANERYLPQLRATRASAVLVNEAARAETALPRIVCANPYAYFAHVSAWLNPPDPPRGGVHRTAVVSKGARVARGTEVGPYAVVATGARIGAGS